MAERGSFDEEAYHQRVENGPCFVCATVAGHPDYRHDVLFEDERTIAFLSRYPTQLGHSIVAPRIHIERWEADQSVEDHLRIQAVLFALSRSLSAALPTERVYVLSLGSAAGNAHVHWQVVPLPPDVPYAEQQFHAVMAERGIILVDDEAATRLAVQVQESMRFLQP